MNKRLLFICAVLLITVKSQGQQRTAKPQEPPKKASKIIVMVKDSANALMDKLTKTLFDYGFTIDNKDEKLKLLSTKERTLKKYNALVKIRASINDTAVLFVGDIALGFDIELFGIRNHQPSYSEIYYGGAKKSPLREAWNEMDAIAHKVGDNITYAK